MSESGPENEIMAKLGLVNENYQYLIVSEKSKKNDIARPLVKRLGILPNFNSFFGRLL